MGIEAYEGKRYRLKTDHTDNEWTVGGEIANPATGIVELQLGRNMRNPVVGPRDYMRLTPTVTFVNLYEEEP